MKLRANSLTPGTIQNFTFRVSDFGKFSALQLYLDKVTDQWGIQNGTIHVARLPNHKTHRAFKPFSQSLAGLPSVLGGTGMRNIMFDACANCVTSEVTIVTSNRAIMIPQPLLVTTYR